MGSDVKSWSRVMEYISHTPAIRDVLISGGEPLIFSDDRLEWLLRRCARSTFDMIRFSTKVTAVLPQRITTSLVRMLKKFHPLWLSVHFTHPDELTRKSKKPAAGGGRGHPDVQPDRFAPGRKRRRRNDQTADAGPAQGRVKPYYLHQCDAFTGSSHFRTPVQKGIDIIRSLHGFTTGYAVPMYMIDARGAAEKCRLRRNMCSCSKRQELLLRNYRGRPSTTATRRRDFEIASTFEFRQFRPVDHPFIGHQLVGFIIVGNAPRTVPVHPEDGPGKIGLDAPENTSAPNGPFRSTRCPAPLARLP